MVDRVAEQQRVTVVGGGLAGALFAIHLARAGHKVGVYERRADMRAANAAKGRSINLAISARGLNALKQVGLEQEVLGAAVPMRGRMIHAVDGALAFQPYGKDDTEVIHSVSRGGLNRILLEAAGRAPNVAMHFNERCTDLDPQSAAVEFENMTTGAHSKVAGDFLVGADGAFSAVRARLQRLDRFSFSQDYLDYGYKELNIPAGANGQFQMEKNALHIWPRRKFMMIALPNFDGSFTVTLFWPLEGEHGFASLQTETQVRDYFQRWFPDAVPLMPALVGDYLDAPASTLVTIRSYPWSITDRVVLIGDACHAVVPFYGQGMNAAFEDCTVLAECMARSPGDRRGAFLAYERARKPHVDALADLALENFVEMRDHVASRTFRWKKKGEKLLHKFFPKWYIPLYTLVSFTLTPYAEATQRARKQARCVRLACMAIAVGAVALLVCLFIFFRSR